MRTMRRGRSAAVAVLATTSVAVSGLVVAPQTALAAPSSAVASVLAAEAGSQWSSEDVTVRVDEDGVARFSMPEALYRSKQRVVLYVDGKYQGETYDSHQYYLGASTVDGVTTLSRGGMQPGQVVEVGLVAGSPGYSASYSTADIVASTVAWGQVTNLRVVNGTTVEFTIPEKLFRASKRVLLWVDGKYATEAYAGRTPYASHSVHDGLVTVRRGMSSAPVDTLEVGLVPGSPGSRYDRADVVTLGVLALPGRGTDVTVQEQYSQVTVITRGNAEADRRRENRAYRHSVLEPTGRFVRAGEEVTVTRPEGAPAMEVKIGQYGPHQGVNDAKSLGFSTTSLKGTQYTVKAPIDGLVFLVNQGDSTVRAGVTGGVAVPVYTLGQSTEAGFQQDVATFDKSPFAIVQGERVLVPFQRRLLEPNVTSVTAERVRYWDDVVNRTDAVYGLSTKATGLDHKSAARVFISNQDSGGGYAFAGHDRIGFQVNTGAGKKLLTGSYDSQWGLWHEVGHTYQVPQKFGGLGEVTCNISALAIQAGHGWDSNLDTPGKQGSIATFLALPDSERNYDSADVWVKLAMFDGLTQQFGEGYYPKLHRTFRQDAAAGTISLPDNEARKQYFMVTAGQVAQHDLTSYFQKWGLQPDAATQTALAKYPS
ncbi:M60 family metallopeptidase [Isoptericola sp. NPDC057191]|uniref:M60 family metallopeptidase n=1 Tax=Isoptericola sp. NPDC057191 TaxID=3346041 RepID=UPI00363F4BA6